MYMKLLMPVIEGRVEGTNLTFSFDTGASGTNLSVRYYDRFRSQSAKWQKGETKNSGAGGIVTQTTYFQPRLDLLIGNRTVTLDRVAIFPSKVGAEVDDLYGNLGQDVVEKFDSFTLDFSAMTFSLGDPLPAHAAH